MSFIGRSSFERPVTCAWSPSSNLKQQQEKLLATATLDGGGVGFGDVDSDFFSNLALNEIDLSTGQLVERNSVKVHNQRFASLAWGKQGLLAGGMTDGSVKLWTASTLAHKTDLSTPGGGSSTGNVFIRAMQFHPNASVHQLAHSGPKKQVMVTDVSTLSVLLETPSQAGEVSAVAWNLADAAKHIFASGNLDSTTAVWDLRTKKPTCEIRDPRGASITCLAWSPNTSNSYHLLLANDSGMLRLFDLRSSTSTPMTEVQATTASNVGIFDLDWCPQDDNMLVTCSKDNRMLLWDMGTNQVMCEMQQDSHTQQHQLHQQTSNRRYQVDWSPTTPGLIAACSFDRSLQLFSINNTLPRCPAWVKHSGKGARFGFGGRLVEFSTDQQVTLSNVHEDANWSSLLEFERKLEVSIARDQETQTRDHLLLFCAEQEAKATSPAIKEIWQVLRVLLADNPRSAMQKFLGYNEEEILGTTGVDFNSPPAVQEEAIVRALTIGRFDFAVDLCFACKRYDEALYLAGMMGSGSGPELLMQAQERFALEKQATSRVMQLAKSIADPTHSCAEDWKQQVALLQSFVTSPEDFAAQVNLVAQSQELEPQMVCYMLARNVNKVGESWARVISEDDEFCEIGQVFSQVLPSPEEFQMDRVMMNRFARLANRMADEGKFDLAKKYATIAAGVDYEAADLVQRIEYGLVWTAESEAKAKEEEERWRAQQEEEERLQAEQAAALAQQQAEQAAAYEQQQALYAQQQAGQAAMYAQQQQQYYQQPQQQHYPPQQQYGALPAYGYQQQSAAYHHPPIHQQQAYAQQPTYNAPVQQAYAPPPQPAYVPPPQPAYVPPPQPAYVPPPQPAYVPPPQPAYVPPQIPSYAPPPVAAPVQQQAYQAPPPPPYVAPAAYAQPPPSSPPAPQPRVPENDGFGTTAGNASAGDKYGNRTVNRSMPAPAPVAPRPVDPALQAAVSTLQRSVQQLKQRYSAQAPGSMEERRLLEAEKGITALANSLPTLNDFFQQKLKELAGAVERSNFSEAHNIQLTLSSSSDWKEHKEWIKGLSHLIGVAQKDSQPKPAAAGANGAYRGPPMSGGPPTSYPPTAVAPSQYPPVYQ